MTSVEDKPTEKDPLLNSPTPSLDEDIKDVKCTDRFSKDKVRNLVTAACLWMGYLIVSAAYSLLGPFFPGEVSLFMKNKRSILKLPFSFNKICY